MNKQSSCGGTSFPAAVCRGVGKGRPALEHVSLVFQKGITFMKALLRPPRALFVGDS